MNDDLSICYDEIASGIDVKHVSRATVDEPSNALVFTICVQAGSI